MKFFERTPCSLDPEMAAAFFRRACHIRTTLLPPNHVLLGDAMAALGQLLMQEKRRSTLEEAHNLLTKALDIRILRLGPDHSDTRSLLMTLRHLETRQGRLQRQGWPSGTPTTSLSSFSSSSLGSRPCSGVSHLSQRPRRAPPVLNTAHKSRPASASSYVQRESSLEARERYLFGTTFLSSHGGARYSLQHALQGPRSSLEWDLRDQPGRAVRAAFEQTVQFKAAWYNMPGRQLPACLRNEPLRPTTAKPRSCRSSMQSFFDPKD